MQPPFKGATRPEQGWQRLDPRSPVARVARGLPAFAIIAIDGLVAHRRGNNTTLIISAVALVGSLALATISWLVTRWRMDEGVLRIDSGLIRRTSRRFPPEQIQAVDIVRPAAARVFGVAELRIRMAASTGTSARLGFLSDADAEALRARLLALAHGVAEHTPAPPERVLYTIPTGQLIASILLSGIGLICELVVIGLIALAIVKPDSVAPTVAATATALIVLATSAFRRLNGEFELTVSEAPDGLRLRSGLLQTTAETIPRGRVQGVRMIEPVLWRPLGWCRVVVDVAGKQRSGRENQSVSGAFRAVLPVGSHEQGAWILERILPGVPSNGVRPPIRARWKSPLRYPNLSWGRDRSYAVTTGGRIRRVTDWVPLAKVQSIRCVEGPVQRRLQLATVHLDTAGRNIHAIARDRDRGESMQMMEDLPAACREARQPGLSGPGD